MLWAWVPWMALLRPLCWPCGRCAACAVGGFNGQPKQQLGQVAQRLWLLLGCWEFCGNDLPAQVGFRPKHQ